MRNQDGGCPWCQVDHITFEQNLVRHAAGGVQILGVDNEHPSQQTQAITIRNNVFSDIDNQNRGGNGYFLQLTDGARDITVDHNTVIQDHAYGITQIDGPPVLGLTFTNNLMRHNAYGFIGTNHGVGNDSISAFLPGSQIVRNVMAGGSASSYPSDNLFPTTAEFEAQFVSYAGGDYHLIDGSPWRGAGTDGKDLGAAFDGSIGGGSGTGGGGAAPAARVLAITADLPSGLVGAAYAGSLEETGGNGPYTWRMTSGALPRGLGLDAASGTIAGAPEAFGVFQIGVSVSDSSTPPVTVAATATLTIAPRPVRIVSGAALASAAIGLRYRIPVSAADGAPPYHWQLVSGALPTGLSLDSAPA